MTPVVRDDTKERGSVVPHLDQKLLGDGWEHGDGLGLTALGVMGVPHHVHHIPLHPHPFPDRHGHE